MSGCDQVGFALALLRMRAEGLPTRELPNSLHANWILLMAGSVGVDETDQVAVGVAAGDRRFGNGRRLFLDGRRLNAATCLARGLGGVQLLAFAYRLLDPALIRRKHGAGVLAGHGEPQEQPRGEDEEEDRNASHGTPDKVPPRAAPALEARCGNC